MWKYGIMQGRLTRPKGRGIQFFPFENWRQEFDEAAELGLDEIEFIFDYERYEDNPIWDDDGQDVGRAVNEAGVKVNSVCFDYFMRRPFYKYDVSSRDNVRKENINIINRIISNMSAQGIGLIEIPLVDNSSIKDDEQMKMFSGFLDEVIADLPKGIKIGLEADFDPETFRHFLDKYDSSIIGANYDTGNSSGIGYDPVKELSAYGNRILNIHIKDRVLNGTTVELGTGSARFDDFFASLSRTGYNGSFILQAARGIDGQEKDNIRKQLEFVKRYVHKYLSDGTGIKK